ncbi:putative protein CHAPERONE-LIKE PROTEIN OF POR1 [Helianthus anomalus]
MQDLAAGSVVGSAFENWLQVDILPFLGIHSPETVSTKKRTFFLFIIFYIWVFYT